ncbi:MAG: phage tail tape measure protein [Pseudomonas farsensis]|uniref:phage tail tape measure protein n=1 Tax=Pseudomonas farsensis TaxID=2745492 RepID=UPI003C7CC818
MADKFQLKALITGVDKLSPVLKGVRKNVASLRKQIDSSGLGKISLEDAVQGGAIAAPFVMGVKAAIDFESAMADVKKVVNFESPAQFKAMGDDVLDLSERLPMAAEGIAAIVAAGGQSGIAREELGRFAEDAVKMGVAFDQTADQSGDMMSTWRTAFRMTQDGVVELADQINYLGNTGPANTKQISTIVTEVGALGEVAGLTSAQVAAIGATMAGVGVKHDVAATGIKNFMLAMTKGSAATKAQSQAFKALRLDSKTVAENMQKDSQGTMLDLLKRISEVDAAKRPALLTNLFGSESVSAITPLVTNLDLLTGNLTKVGDATKYAGSMEAEYTARAATTANALQLMQNRVTRLGISVGSILLPPLNEFLVAVGPLVSNMTAFAAANPAVVKSILAMAVGFAALRIAAFLTAQTLLLVDAIAKMSTIGLIVRGIALAAGLVIANWSTVGPYFMRVWDMIKGPLETLWNVVKMVFSWTPLGRVIANWGPLTEFFGALWEFIKAAAGPFMDFMLRVFERSPLGPVIKAWKPLVGFFKALWDEIKPFIEPLMRFFDSDNSEAINGATDRVKGWTADLKARSGEPEAGALVRPLRATPEMYSGMASSASLLRAPGGPVPGSLIQQAAQGQRQGLEGSIAVRFENAPPGMRVEEAKTNQPGVSVSQNVGYRSLSRG